MNIETLLRKLQSLKTRQEANEFLIKELQSNPQAWNNIKYVSGYLGNEERNRILNLFDAD